MKPYFSDDLVTLYHGKCEEILPSLPAASVDACVTDPPYGLSELPRKQVEKALAAWLSGDRLHVPDGRGFMGAEWDKFVPPPGVWDEVYRVLKPGAYLLAFCAPRTYDLMGLSIRLAGFEIQDSIDWIFGTGFPKSRGRLKPAHEPVVLAWKPAKYATEFPGLEACKVAHASEADLAASLSKNPGRDDTVTSGTYGANRPQQSVDEAGRWPPNVVFSHRPECREIGVRTVKANPGGLRRGGGRTAQSDWRMRDQERSKRYGVGGSETVEAWDCVPECPVAELDRQSGVSTSTGGSRGAGGQHGAFSPIGAQPDFKPGLGDTGGASRFFPVFRYEAKAPASERPRLADGTTWSTVKPLSFMRWAARLITPPGGTVLEPFAGTFTTAEACIIEGFPCIAIDQDEKALRLGMQRLSKPIQPVMFGFDEAG